MRKYTQHTTTINQPSQLQDIVVDPPRLRTDETTYGFDDSLLNPLQDDSTATSSPHRSSQPHGSVVNTQRLRPDSTAKAHVLTESPNLHDTETTPQWVHQSPDSQASQLNDGIVGDMPELEADPQRSRKGVTPPAPQHPCSQDPVPQRLSTAPSPVQESESTTPARPQRQVRPRKKYIPETGKWE